MAGSLARVTREDWCALMERLGRLERDAEIAETTSSLTTVSLKV